VRNWIRQPLPLSLSVHLAALLFCYLVIVMLSPFLKGKRTIQVQVIEKEVDLTKTQTSPKAIEIEKAKPLEPPKQPVKKVFGISKKTLTADAGSGAKIKGGNTVAKDLDNEKYDADASLPIPTDEYLVTSMPKLRAEVRVPYPAEAKQKGIEGVVLFELLIDDQGRVRKAVLLEGPGHGLNEAAMDAIYKFEFVPAQVSGRAVPVKIRYAYRFVLN
jgi:protein TonB